MSIMSNGKEGRESVNANSLFTRIRSEEELATREYEAWFGNRSTAGVSHLVEVDDVVNRLRFLNSIYTFQGIKPHDGGSGRDMRNLDFVFDGLCLSVIWDSNPNVFSMMEIAYFPSLPSGGVLFPCSLEMGILNLVQRDGLIIPFNEEAVRKSRMSLRRKSYAGSIARTER